jgi:hypothetical protein
MSYDIPGTSDVPRTGEAQVELAPRRLSQIFADLAAEASGPISVGAIRDALGDRSFAALLVLFAAINLLPFPPGATLIFGLPLILVSAQMVLGYRNAWLPRMLLDKSIDAERFRRSTIRLIPLLQRLERLVKPRHWPFSRAAADRVIGLVALVLAIAVTLPIPLGNWLPAFAIAVIGLALSERDGLFFAFAIALGAISFIVIGAVVGAAGAIAGAMFGVHF